MKRGKGELTYGQLKVLYGNLKKENIKLKNDLNSLRVAHNNLLDKIKNK